MLKSLDESRLCEFAVCVVARLDDTESIAVRKLDNEWLGMLAEAAPVKTASDTCKEMSSVDEVNADGIDVTLARFAAQFCTLSTSASSEVVKFIRLFIRAARASCCAFSAAADSSHEVPK